ncbi:MAG: hypothetical protein IJJ66_01760 [Treponema sp.]|nr:hypothetical protein [Treponema sp.]
MLAVNGYYDGNVCLVKEKVSQKPQKVIITFLNEDIIPEEKKEFSEEEKLKALEEVQELWKNHDNSMSVDEYVRNMRKGRQFDI